MTNGTYTNADDLHALPTDREIGRGAWVEPATGERAKLLRQMSDAAFQMIKTIELELSGIRDGDGYWEGSDVIGSMTDHLTHLIERLKQAS